MEEHDSRTEIDEERRARHRLEPERIFEFEKKFAIPFDASRRSLRGLDAVVLKEYQVIETAQTLRMNLPTRTPYLVGPCDVGKKTLLAAVVEEVNSLRATGTTLTKNPSFQQEVMALSQSLPPGVPQRVIVYDFQTHNAKELLFMTRDEAKQFCEDVMTFYYALIEEWESENLEEPTGARYHKNKAKNELKQRIEERRGEERFKGLKFKLVPTGKDFDIELDLGDHATLAYVGSHADKARDLLNEFREGPFKTYYAQYHREITPYAISKKNIKAKKVMTENLIAKENMLRSRLGMDRISSADEKTLRAHFNMYPTTNEALIQLFSAIFREKYARSKAAHEWISELEEFLSVRQMQKVLDTGVVDKEGFEVNIGGRDLTLDEIVRPHLPPDANHGAGLTFRNVIDPTMETLFGQVHSFKYTAPQHSILYGDLARYNFVNIEFGASILENNDVVSKLLECIHNKRYVLSDGEVTLEVFSPCIITFSGTGEEFSDSPIITNHLHHIEFPGRTDATKESLEGIQTAMQTEFTMYNKRNPKDRIRPHVKSGFEAALRIARGFTGYSDQVSSQIGLFVKEGLAIARWAAPEQHVSDQTYVQFLQRRMRENHMARQYRRWYQSLYPSAPPLLEVGTCIGLSVIDGPQNQVFSGFGIPGPVNVSVTPGQRTVYSTGKGPLEGPVLEKGNQTAQMFWNHLHKGNYLGLHINFKFDFEPTEGWSASSPIVFSAISDFTEHPIDQRIAVTGFIADSQGHIGKIGGISDKVYGWYLTAKEVCTRFQLPFDGYGILFPATNLDEFLTNLPFFPDLAQDVEKGTFSAYTMQHVIDGIEVLMGRDGQAELELVKSNGKKWKMPREHYDE